MRTSNTKHPSSDDQGVVALEFVLVAPFLIGLLLTIASFGAFFIKKVEVTSAARDAARTVALGDDPDDPPEMRIVIVKDCAAGDIEEDAIVEVFLIEDHDFPAFGPISLGSRPISAIGTMRCGG